MRRVLTVLTLLATSVALAGPGDNSLVVATSQEPPSMRAADFLSVVSSAAIASEIGLYTSSTLYRTNIDGEEEPFLATEVATVENGRLRFEDVGDGVQRLEIDITLRDDATWSDGTPITSADAQLAFDIGTAPGMPVASPDFWARIGLEVTDEQNFTVSFEPAQNSDLIGSPIALIPSHVMGPVWEETSAGVANLDAEADAQQIAESYVAFFTQFGSPQAVNEGRMVYSGAFIPTRWVAGNLIEMERNPNFFVQPEDGADSYVQRVQYRFFTDTNALLVAVLGGGVDATSSVALTFDQGISPQLQSRAGTIFDIWFIASPTWEHLDVNQFADTVEEVADLQLDDVRTRQAMLHAIDRDTMVEALFEGLQPVSHTNVNPVHPWYNDSVTQYNYDPERAAELFAELGWEPGPDGILTRTTDDGREVRFELEFVTTAGNAIRERQQQFIAEDWQQAGIAVNINNAPAQVVFDDSFSSRAYEGSFRGVFMFAWVSSLASTANAELYTCGARPLPANGFVGQNYGGYCSERYDEVRQRGVREFDLEAAAPIYREMQEVYAEDLPAIPLFFRSNPIVTRTGLLNYTTNTYANGFGYPPAEPWLVGWEQNGAQQVYDQADYALETE